MNAEQKKVEVCIPGFHGFYESVWSRAVDDAETYFLDAENELDDGTRAFPADMPADMRASILWRRTDYRAAFQTIAREYAAHYGAAFEDATGVPLSTEFAELVSPREYNFTTDRIFVRVPLVELAAIREAIGDDVLRAYCEEQFRPRSGFAPFGCYKGGDISQWPASMAEWDHNMTGCIIGAALSRHDDDDGRAFEWRMHEDLSEACDIYRAWESSVDWDAIAADVAEWKEEAAQ